jgi:hypothetical protein
VVNTIALAISSTGVPISAATAILSNASGIDIRLAKSSYASAGSVISGGRSCASAPNSPVKEDPGIGPSNITKSLSSMSHPYAIVDLPIEPLTAPSSVSTDFIKLSCLDINEAT